MSSRTLALTVLLLAACGRSSMTGGSPFDCPPEELQEDGTCGGADLGGDLGNSDLLGFCRDTCGALGCDQAGCCACLQCQSAAFCATDMKPDMEDPCADENNCALPVCVGDPRCHIPGTEVCNNGLDDDDDELVDCADPDCAGFPGCTPHTCDPSAPDCTDPACIDDPACKDLLCHPTVSFGPLQKTMSSSMRTMDTTGTVDVAITPCAPGGAGMVVGQFTLIDESDLTLSWSQLSGDDHVFGLFRAGVNQQCTQNPVECFDPKTQPSGSHSYPSLGKGDYYLITQAFSPGRQGPVTVTLSTPSVPEVCNNGVDDNGNGLIDCAEASCQAAPNCVVNQCVPDINLGALVVNGPAKSASFDTTAADADNDLLCQAAPGGKDVVVRFTLHETGGILLQWSQSGDHVVALTESPAPGLPCDSEQRSCYDPSGRTQDTVAWEDRPPGDYAFIFKALRPGQEGHLDITVSAYRPRDVELCHNGIDDDNNGLIDCTDPACAGVAGCSAPYCMPDVQIGDMVVGDSRSVTLDIKNDGISGYDVSCAQGDAKGMVVQLKVVATGGVAIGFDCTQTGDHVIDLFAAGGPRDTCDHTDLVCADPKTLPFGCGYAVPNLDPGEYNVIVEGFTPGSEGTMNLTLSILEDRQLEVCNNGIDDDGDGKIDCADRKCATSPFCLGTRCLADQLIDPVPLNGTSSFRLVQTAGNGVKGAVPCATTQGGQTAVIELMLTAAADLTLQWNQIGNHDFALYTKDAPALACDAGTLQACVKSNDTISGSAALNDVPAGRYYLVIGADAPDTMMVQSSGSVNIALSGMPVP